MRAKNLFAIVAATLTFATMSVVAPLEADAAPGTCKCNQGCHANPGQCLNGAACNFGYAPSCGFRDADAGADCPKSDYISCNGTCVCTPIPGFCETIGGAEFCDSGPPDTGLPDTEKPDTEMPDTRDTEPLPDTADTFVEPDTFVPPDTRDTEPLPDTADTRDTEMPDTRDTEPLPDTMDTMPVDSCVPLVCPMGFKTIIVPGNCDPYCAQPCGTGEFKCFGGLVCVDNFCVPKGPGDGGMSCLSTGCPDCQKCNLTDGICFVDPTRCADSGAGDGGGGSDGGDPDGTVVTDTAGGDGSVNPGDDTGGTSTDGTIGDDTGVPTTTDGSIDNDGSVNPGDPTADPGTEGGCGCSVPGNNAENTLAALTAAAALALVFARRRKK